MNGLYEKLRNHLGHDVSIAGYGLPLGSDNPQEIALECDSCCETIFDTDLYDIVGLPAS